MLAREQSWHGLSSAVLRLAGWFVWRAVFLFLPVRRHCRLGACSLFRANCFCQTKTYIRCERLATPQITAPPPFHSPTTSRSQTHSPTSSRALTCHHHKQAVKMRLYITSNRRLLVHNDIPHDRHRHRHQHPRVRQY